EQAAPDDGELAARLEAAPEFFDPLEGHDLDLHPEELLIRLDCLVADLRRELQREACRLDLHRNGRDVLRLAGRGLLCAGRRVLLEAVQLSALTGEHVAEGLAAARRLRRD